MAWEMIFHNPKLSLSEVQTIFGFILSILVIGYFFYVTNLAKFMAFGQSRRRGEVLVKEYLIPTGILEVRRILRRRKTKPVMFICVSFILCQLLTILHSYIISNHVTYDETCETIDTITTAQITNNYSTLVYNLQPEVESMRTRRIKGGVPNDTVVGQIPIDPRWKFDPNLDVDPYPWRSHCTPYASGKTQVNLDVSIMKYSNCPIKDRGDSSCMNLLIQALPEVDEKYVFGNRPKGYNTGPTNFRLIKTFYHENGVYVSNGTLIMAVEGFNNARDSLEVGAKFMDRMWTLRVPQGYRIPLHSNEVMPVNITVKAHSCEMERVKKGERVEAGERGSFGLLYRNSYTSMMDGIGSLLAIKWVIASVRGDTSEPEITPDYWASFLNTQSIVKLREEEVLAQLIVPCIKIHPKYYVLVIILFLFSARGIILWNKVQSQGFKMPTGPVDWAELACKEAGESIENATLSVISNELGITQKRTP